MVIAVVLQVVAVVAFVTGGFLLADWSGALTAVAVPTFLVGWQLEQRHEGG